MNCIWHKLDLRHLKDENNTISLNSQLGLRWSLEVKWKGKLSFFLSIGEFERWVKENYNLSNNFYECISDAIVILKWDLIWKFSENYLNLDCSLTDLTTLNLLRSNTGYSWIGKFEQFNWCFS